MRDLSKLILAAGVSAVLALTGCNTSQPVTAAQQQVPKQPDDKTITKMIERGLGRDPVFKFPDVDVQTHNGVVQLNGFVLADVQKRRAGEIAQNVYGVVQVQNNLTPRANLQPTSRD